ncbi:MAG: hypothetical protein ABSB79_11065 [Syntrophales bacterium]|jgi:hypothetical protein
MRFEWKSEYSNLAKQFLELHFGGSQGLTTLFPCMRDEYPWDAHRPDVVDSRVPAKNNTEYHGLEKHASQYHATAQYEFAYHHWLLAASWRRDDAKANNFKDAGHEKAFRYCIKQALYNQALYEWQQSPVGKPPAPEDFELSSADIENMERKSWSEIKNFGAKKPQT